MRLLSVFLAVVLAAVVRADVQTVRADIANLTTLLKTLSSDAKLVQSGAIGTAQALQVQVDSVSIHKLLLKGYQDAKDSPPFGTYNSATVGVDFVKLEPQVQQTLQDISTQKDQFGQFSLVVLSNLYQLKQDTKTFGSAAVEKLEKLEQSIAPAILKSIDDAFNRAIVAYGGKET